MDFLKQSIDWAKGEVLSGRIGIISGILMLIAGIAFGYFGKTVMAKALVIPIMTAGLLVAMIAGALFYTNYKRLTSFKEEYAANPPAFMMKEKQRTEKSMSEYKTGLRLLPILVIVAALIFMFIPTPAWRAISIAIILVCVAIFLIDSNADARNTVYHNYILKELQ